MIDAVEWDELKRVFRAAFVSSLHFSIATVGDAGEPVVTPIGSVLLREPGHAIYFEVFAAGLGRRLARDPRVSVLAVDSGKLRWLGGLTRGRFDRAPAVRLAGRADREPRASTEVERERWRRRVWPLLGLRGSRRLWSRLELVRDLWIDRVDAVRIGALTPRG